MCSTFHLRTSLFHIKLPPWKNNLDAWFTSLQGIIRINWSLDAFYQEHFVLSGWWPWLCHRTGQKGELTSLNLTEGAQVDWTLQPEGRAVGMNLREYTLNWRLSVLPPLYNQSSHLACISDARRSETCLGSLGKVSCVVRSIADFDKLLMHKFLQNIVFRQLRALVNFAFTWKVNLNTLILMFKINYVKICHTYPYCPYGAKKPFHNDTTLLHPFIQSF